MCKPGCACQKQSSAINNNLRSGDLQRTSYDGKEVIIVPVIMARGNVVMNDYVLPVDEFVPEAWNGVPITVGHPDDTANTPDTLLDYCIGRIFNAAVVGDTLRGEAWVEVDRCARINSELLQYLESDVNIDVSTGYFCDTEKSSGSMGGRNYNGIHRNIRPDHLAFLPGDVGACSWADGCGVRANRRKRMKMPDLTRVRTPAVIEIPAGVYIRNERGHDDDRRQIIADLVSSGDSPFTPDDQPSLESMSDGTLRRMRDTFKKAAEDPKEQPVDPKSKLPPADAEEPADPQEEEVPADEADSEEPPMDEEVPAEDDEKLKGNRKEFVLSDQDKEALDLARRLRDEHKARLVKHVVANSKISEEAANKMPLDTLEVVANGLAVPKPDYSGIAAPVVINSDQGDSAAKDMVPVGVYDVIRNRKKENA